MIQDHGEFSVQNRKWRDVIISLPLKDKAQSVSQHQLHQLLPSKGAGFPEGENTDGMVMHGDFDWKTGCQQSFWNILRYSCECEPLMSNFGAECFMALELIYTTQTIRGFFSSPAMQLGHD